MRLINPILRTKAGGGAARPLAVILLLPMLLVTGCLTGNSGEEKKNGDKGNNGGNNSGNATLFEFLGEVLDITPSQGSEPGMLVIRSTEYYCEDDGEQFVPGPPQAEKFVDEMLYVITGGNLYLWDAGSCMAEVYTGGSSSLTGTWNGADTMDKVPLAYRDSRCTQAYYDECEEYGDCEEADYSDGGLFEDVSLTVTITTDSMKARMTGKICQAREWAQEMADYASGVELVSSGCTSSELLVESTGKKAKFTSELKDGVLTLEIAYNGMTCTRTEPWSQMTADSECSEYEDAFSSDFGDCLEESGFHEDTGDELEDWNAALFKKSSEARKAPGMSMLRR